MRRRATVVALLVGVPLAALIYWIGNNTYWADAKVPMPLTGEAFTNPSYAAQHFAEALGARATRDRVLTVPPVESVIVLSAWNWNLSPARRQTLERWVESGGRLVVDMTVTGGEEFERWSGIVRKSPELDDPGDSEEDGVYQESAEQRCRAFHPQYSGKAASNDARRWVCDFDAFSFLTSSRTPEWALGEAEAGVQAMRVRVGRGSVTVVNADPFRYRNLFDGDHGWLFVTASQLRPGDDVHFLSERDHPSLLALIWQHGGPVVGLSLMLVALMLWRGSVRLGPLAAPPATARRSLAEQIRGTGRFVLHHGGGESLHAASIRALDEAARRRVPGYARLRGKERTAALAQLTGFEPNALAAAIYHPRMRRSQELRETVALIETARRRLIQ